jgi:hypothetical protein
MADHRYDAIKKIQRLPMKSGGCLTQNWQRNIKTYATCMSNRWLAFIIMRQSFVKKNDICNQHNKQRGKCCTSTSAPVRHLQALSHYPRRFFSTLRENLKGRAWALKFTVRCWKCRGCSYRNTIKVPTRCWRCRTGAEALNRCWVQNFPPWQ